MEFNLLSLETPNPPTYLVATTGGAAENQRNNRKPSPISRSSVSPRLSTLPAGGIPPALGSLCQKCYLLWWYGSQTQGSASSGLKTYYPKHAKQIIQLLPAKQIMYTCYKPIRFLNFLLEYLFVHLFIKAMIYYLYQYYLLYIVFKSVSLVMFEIFGVQCNTPLILVMQLICLNAFHTLSISFYYGIESHLFLFVTPIQSLIFLWTVFI